MFKKSAVSHKVLIFNDDNSITLQNVVDYNADCVETATGLFHLKDCKTYVDKVRGGLVYVFSADIPSLIEAENLRNLRRSTVLKRVFEFQTGDGKLNWSTIMPWIIIVLLILFRR